MGQHRLQDERTRPASLEPAVAANQGINQLFGRDLLYVVVASVQLLATAIMSPVLARLLDAEAFGRLATATAIYQFVSVVAVVGLDQVAVLLNSREGGARDARFVVLSGVVYAFGLAGACLALGPLWIKALGTDTFGGVYLLAIIWSAPGAVNLIAVSLLRAQDRLGAFCVVSVTSGIGGQLLGIVLALGISRSDTTYAWGGVVAQFIGLALALRFVRPRWTDTPGKVTTIALRLGVPLAVNAMAVFVLNVGDRVIIQHYLGDAAVGRYQVSYVAGSVVIIVLTVLNQTWLPRMLTVADTRDRWRLIQDARDNLQKVTACLVIALSASSPLLLIIVAPPALRGTDSETLVAVIAAAALPFVDGNATSQNLISRHHTAHVALGTILAAVANVVLCIVWIPQHGILGAAYATLAAFALRAMAFRMSARLTGSTGRVGALYALTVLMGLVVSLAVPIYGAPHLGLFSRSAITVVALAAALAFLLAARRSMSSPPPSKGPHDAMTDTIRPQGLDAIRAATAEVYAAVLGTSRKVAILDFPAHKNAGDGLIYAGQRRYLEDLGVEVLYVCDQYQYRRETVRRLPAETVLLLQGGGNFGDRYSYYQEFRERVISDFPDRKIVQLPQSFEFKDEGNLARSVSVYSQHPDLTLLMRDHWSLQKTQEAFHGCDVRFCPDSALGWRPPHPETPRHPSSDVVALLRTDGETAGGTDVLSYLDPSITVEVADWFSLLGAYRAIYPLSQVPRWAVRAVPLVAAPLAPLVGASYNTLLRVVMGSAVQRLERGRLVVTDRLHALVLSALLGIPVIAMDNANGKIGRTARDYLSSLDGVHFVASPEEAADTARSLLQEGHGKTAARVVAIDDEPTIEVVICCYTERRWDSIVEAVDALAHQERSPDRVVVVVDHNETLLARAERELPERTDLPLTVLPNGRRRGLSGARNTAIEHSQSGLLAFLDDDATPEPGWLAELVRALDEHPAALVSGGYAKPAWIDRRPSWFPPEFDWVIGCTYEGMPTKTTTVRNVHGATMLFRREAFARAGQFTEEVGRVDTIPLGCEETELCIRIQQRVPGSEVVYVPSSIVNHHVSADRTTFRYFYSRCRAEGQSKAAIARLVGAESSTSTERSYVSRTLVRGFVGYVGQAPRRPASAARALVLASGLFVTVLGYAEGRLKSGFARARRNATS